MSVDVHRNVDRDATRVIAGEEWDACDVGRDAFGSTEGDGPAVVDDVALPSTVAVPEREGDGNDEEQGALTGDDGILLVLLLCGEKVPNRDVAK